MPNAPATPALSSPTNGATNVATSTSLTWATASGATSYDVYFGTSNPPSLVGNTTSLSYAVSSLSSSTTYYWQIVGKNAGGSTPSATWSFATVPNAPATPSLSSPANSATNVATSTSLTWATASGATSYDVYFGTSNPPSLVGNTTSLSYGVSSLSTATTYYWKVVAKNAAGNTSSATWSFTTIPNAPSAPALSSPANGATGVARTTALTWSAATGATSYDVYFGTSNPPPLVTNTTSLTYPAASLGAGTVYYWQIVAKNTAGNTASATWSFTTIVNTPATPLLSSPANAATNVATSTSLAWSTASGATSYDVYFGTSNPPPLVTNTTGLSYAVASLTTNTTYYWQVVAKNSAGNTASATWSFTTVPNAPSAPTLSSPSNGATNVARTTLLTWSAGSGATSYDIYLGTSNPPALVGNTTSLSYQATSLNGGATYYWQVVAKNGGGTAGSATWSFTTIVNTPATPVLSSPSNGAANVPTSTNLAWSTASGATSYDVYFGTSNPPPLVGNTTGLTYAVTSLANTTTYYWQIVAKNVAGNTGSATWSFTTVQNAPAAPSLSSPASGATGVPLSTVLAWSAASGATSYDVYLGTSNPPGLLGNTTGLSYPVSSLSTAATYYWRVVAKNGAGGTGSATWSFTTVSNGPAAPILVSPTNGATNVPASTTLTWQASSGATSYDVYFGTSNPPPMVANTEVQTYSALALTTGTTYYWQIVAKNASGSTPSVLASFSTVPALPAPPTLLSPTNGATSVAVNTSLTWNPASGATAYDVYFGTSNPPPLATSTTGTNFTPGTLTQGTTYYWRVTATNAGGHSPSSIWAFSTTAAPAAELTLLSPPNGSTSVPLTTTLSWSAASGATSYDVYFGTTANPPMVANTTGLAYSAPLLTAGTTYYWKVVGRLASSTATSPTWSFSTTPNPPGAPYLTSPGNGATNVSLSPSLTWSAADGATAYDVYFGTSNPPPSVTSTSGLSFAPGSLTAGATYYWNIAARNSGGTTYSSTWSFTTQTSTLSAPTLISPSAGTLVGTSPVSLVWGGVTDATSYDVYFGTTNPPPQVTTTAATTFSVTVESGSTYYWKVASRNAGGTAMSAVSSFQASFGPPDAPALSSPMDGATSVPLATMLIWSPAAKATSYDVYLGTVNPPPLVGSVKSVTFVPVLAPSTTYYWKVGARNDGGVAESGIASFTTADQSLSGTMFVPVTPCRVVDTRADQKMADPFGPPFFASGTARTFPVPSSPCGIPATARAYSLNVTVMPKGARLAYLTLWPTGQDQPLVATLNSPNGDLVTNTAITPAGMNGSIDAYATDTTDLVIDINGYFDVARPTAASYSFYAAAPCRLLDTRSPDGPFGGPTLGAGGSRDFMFATSPCLVPTSATALSMNVAVVPAGPLGYVTLWPTGQPQPTPPTLRSPDARIISNAAVVPVGPGVGVSAYASDRTDLVLDVNGYFAPPGRGAALVFYPVTPCRLMDTRGDVGPFGGPILEGGSSRAIQPSATSCGIPATAKAFSLNITVVPSEPLGYLTVWPTAQDQPLVATLNSDGRILGNASIVAGDSNGSISFYVTNRTHLVVDVTGYFAAAP